MKNMACHLLIVFTLFLTGCGYISDKPVENIDVYRSEELQTCKIDVSKLGEIFTADQKQQIRCLQENFVQFTKYVRSQKPGAVSEGEMSIFVKRFFAGQSDAIIKGLSLIFQLNMILLKDEADRISHNKISPLFELLVQVNQEAIIITDIIRQLSEAKNQPQFWALREKFIASITRFSKSAVGVIEKSPGLEQQLNLKTFILDASKKIGEEELDEEILDSFIFLKRILIAGDKEIITSEELKNIIKKIPDVVSVIFDIYYVESENFTKNTDELKFYLTAIRKIYTVIDFNQPNFTLFTSEQLVKISENFETEIEVRKFKESVEALKARFIGGKKDIVTLVDLKVTLDIILDGAERLYFNNLTYDSYRHNLEMRNPLTELKPLSLDGYDVFTARRLSELHESFEDMALNFRYFRNKDSGASFYSSSIIRNKQGFIEALTAKWLSIKVLKAYGHQDQLRIPQLSQEELAQLLLDAKSLLMEFKLWSPKFSTFARNALLLADLFQQQSNGNMSIGINEATEYLGMILSAVEVSGRVNNEMAGLCNPGANPQGPEFGPDCYSKYYFDVLLNKLHYSKSFPRLAAYISSSSAEEVMGFLRGVQGFARDIDSPEVPVNRRDSTLVLGAMINIESTFIRFDTNVDNIIDYAELEEAFKIYRSSIIALAGLKKEQEKYAFPVFLYMASKMEIPKTGGWVNDIKFGTFSSCVTSKFCRDTFMDPILAKRLNIGKLLYYLVNQASAK
jgi:hypothetical protein